MVSITAEDCRIVHGVISRHYGYVDTGLHADMESAGHLGLARAAARWTPQGGATFTSYAWKLVRYAIQDALRDLDHLTRTQRQRVAKGLMVDPGPDEIAHDPTSWVTTLADADPHDHCAAIDTAALVHWALDQLPRNERLVIACADLDGHLLKDIAHMLGVTESRVSQIRTSAHRRMRALITADEWSLRAVTN